jgi:hypothetical protein
VCVSHHGGGFELDEVYNTGQVIEFILLLYCTAKKSLPSGMPDDERIMIVSRSQQSKFKLVGKAVLSLPPKLLKIQHTLVVHLSPKAHLPLRAVALIFL